MVRHLTQNLQVRIATADSQSIRSLFSYSMNPSSRNQRKKRPPSRHTRRTLPGRHPISGDTSEGPFQRGSTHAFNMPIQACLSLVTFMGRESPNSGSPSLPGLVAQKNSADRRPTCPSRWLSYGLGHTIFPPDMPTVVSQSRFLEEPSEL